MSALWAQEQLGRLLTPIERAEPVDPSRLYRLLGARWYAQGLFVKDEKSGQQIKARTLYRVNAGDFVYNRLFAWKGSFAVADDEADGCHVSNEFPCFSINGDRLDPSYLRWWFSRENSWLQALGLSSGATPTSRNRLKEERLLGMEIPLPPLDEQRRIVSHIEKLAAKVKEARELRQEVRERIGAIGASAAYQVFADASMKGVPITTLEKVAEIRAGVTLGRRLAGKTIRLPYLRVANVQDGRLDLRVLKEVEIYPEERAKWLLHPGDILLTEGGDWDKLGRGTVWQDEVAHCIHQNHIFRVRVDPTRFDPWYISALVSSPRGKEFFQAASKQTTNLASINQRQLKSFPIFDLPLERQRAMVAELDTLQAKVGALNALQTETAAELNAMLPAILAKAFSGELA